MNWHAFFFKTQERANKKEVYDTNYSLMNIYNWKCATIKTFCLSRLHMWKQFQKEYARGKLLFGWVFALGVCIINASLNCFHISVFLNSSSLIPSSSSLDSESCWTYKKCRVNFGVRTCEVSSLFCRYYFPSLYCFDFVTSLVSVTGSYTEAEPKCRS